MFANIVVDIKETGDPNRGYHNYKGTVTFQYTSDSTWIEEKEQKIVEEITGYRDRWMWYSISNEDVLNPHIWSVNYGYDSGD